MGGIKGRSLPNPLPQGERELVSQIVHQRWTRAEGLIFSKQREII